MKPGTILVSDRKRYDDCICDVDRSFYVVFRNMGTFVEILPIGNISYCEKRTLYVIPNVSEIQQETFRRKIMAGAWWSIGSNDENESYISIENEYFEIVATKWDGKPIKDNNKFSFYPKPDKKEIVNKQNNNSEDRDIKKFEKLVKTYGAKNER